MNEKLRYRGTRGRIEIMPTHLEVVFDIKSPEALTKIRKALVLWIPTATKYLWETDDKSAWHVPTKGGYKDTFRWDGEYPLDLPKESLQDVIKAIGYRKASPATLAHLTQGRAAKHTKQAQTSIGEVPA